MATPQVIIAINQFINAATGGNAYTTISSRAYVRRQKHGGSLLADFLDVIFFWHQKYGGHCRYAFLTDMARWRSLVITDGDSPFYLNVNNWLEK